MKNIFLFICIFLFVADISSQIITLTPSGVGADEEATLIFDATQGNGELIGEDKVYIHHGVVTSNPDWTDWSYVIGNWGQDNGVGEMTRVEGETDKWQIKFSPTIRSYFGVPSNENIFRISCVFRSADGNKKGTTNPGVYGWGTVEGNLDYFIDLNIDNYIAFVSPSNTESYVSIGESIEVKVLASSSVTNMSLYLDEGSGYEEKKTITSGNELVYDYFPQESKIIKARVNAVINGEALEIFVTHQVVIKKDSPIAPLPPGVKAGINYYQNNDQNAILVLQAPKKNFAYLVGDFTNWEVQEDYLMYQTPDKEYFWLEIGNLTPEKEYAFQYWVDGGQIKIADPYADKVLDPWNDEYIEDEVYPDLLEYNYTEYGIASVLQTGQSLFSWDSAEDSWQRPNKDHLIIYELHIRDFVENHSYKTLIDTLSYLKRLGVQAIELMPINEFEGNDSWGYNPTFFFAPDKYYGTKDDLKNFIQAAHKEGLAVILDIVLNHAYWNPLVELYWDPFSQQVTADNPWFNQKNVGQYSWGFDFNHESKYTQDFIDRVNAYWIEEFHFDGFRFDFTKGFTNYAPGGNVDGFDQSRIDLIKRMSSKIWEVDNKAYVILEHWGVSTEENQLAAHGCKMWRNKSYDFVPATIGTNSGSFSGIDASSHISFFDSHDERRIAEHCITEGRSNGPYNIKDEEIMFERVKMAAAFMFLAPGPKMMWQFDELGYDIDINLNGRTGKKPSPWGVNGLGYYENTLRQNIYKAYQGILDVRKKVGPVSMSTAITKIKNTGTTRRYSYDTGNIDLVVVANFGLNDSSVNPEFTQLGKWYDYFSGEEIEVTNKTASLSLKAGEWHIYTTVKLSSGKPNVVAIYSNPVTISPSVFSIHDEITITFDATKAFPANTLGLVGADKVYIHAGLVSGDPNGKDLSFIIGNLIDDGIGQMSSLGNDKWEIKLKISDYFDVENADEIYKIGMYFRDADNVNLGKGFRDKDIYFDVKSTAPFVWVEPSPYDINTPIKIYFDARQGNGELIGASKVYMHSGIGTLDTQNPQTSAWNNVIGNWGQDDGVGKMTKVVGQSDIWEISLTPKTYYGLADGTYPYWLAAVFRNADGSKKGTGSPGIIEGGFIDSNLDFFIKNNKPSSTSDQNHLDGIVYPNPNFGIIYLRDIEKPFNFTLTNNRGINIKNLLNYNEDLIDISSLSAGIYYYNIFNSSGQKYGKIIKVNN